MIHCFMLLVLCAAPVLCQRLYDPQHHRWYTQEVHPADNSIYIYNDDGAEDDDNCYTDTVIDSCNTYTALNPVTVAHLPETGLNKAHYEFVDTPYSIYVTSDFSQVANNNRISVASCANLHWSTIKTSTIELHTSLPTTMLRLTITNINTRNEMFSNFIPTPSQLNVTAYAASLAQNGYFKGGDGNPTQLALTWEEDEPRYTFSFDFERKTCDESVDFTIEIPACPSCPPLHATLVGHIFYMNRMPTPLQ